MIAKHTTTFLKRGLASCMRRAAVPLTLCSSLGLGLATSCASSPRGAAEGPTTSGGKCWPKSEGFFGGRADVRQIYCRANDSWESGAAWDRDHSKSCRGDAPKKVLPTIARSRVDMEFDHPARVTPADVQRVLVESGFAQVHGEHWLSQSDLIAQQFGELCRVGSVVLRYDEVGRNDFGAWLLGVSGDRLQLYSVGRTVTINITNADSKVDFHYNLEFETPLTGTSG